MARRPSNRRTRPTASSPAPAARSNVPASDWRGTFQSFGGFWTLGGVIVIIAIIAVMFLASQQSTSGSREAFKPRPRTQVAGRLDGSPDAPVKIIEYGDYQCPFCRQYWSDTEQKVQQQFIDTGIASVEFHDFIIIGPDSHTAAEGAACAADQNFFWQMHDILYLRQGQENTGVFSASNVKKFARQAVAADSSIKFDGAAFDKCLDSHAHRADVDKMTAEATGLKMSSTPSFLVNGQVATGALTIDQITNLITSARGPH